MTRQIIFALFALAAVATVAGCTPAARSAAGANSSIAASGGQETQPQAGSPYNQPLMATGGDLVMLRVASRAVAG